MLDPMLAVIVAVFELETELVVMVNVVEVAPGGTSTVVGTCALGSLLAKATVVPEVPEVAETVTVPVLVALPTTDVGASVKEETKTLPVSFATKPEKMIGPHPESVSQPTVATDVAPLGNFPFVPDVTS